MDVCRGDRLLVVEPIVDNVSWTRVVGVCRGERVSQIGRYVDPMSWTCVVGDVVGNNRLR